MTEIRLHGRGGQGVVTCAELIAIAAFYSGKFSQAFPYFGVERRGAPIEAYTRIDNEFINLREQIKEPDIIIIQDASLLATNKNLLNGLKNNGIILINTEKELKELFKNIGKMQKNKKNEDILIINKKSFKVIKIDGTSIALKILGRPIVNTLLVLKLAKITDIINLKSVEKALRDKFSGDLLEKNLLLKNAV